MAEEQDWQRLIDGLRAGDSAVERDFWQRYGPALERLAERRLSPRLQVRVGPEDVVQSACRTFLRRARGGEFQLADSASLWRVLCVITLTKVREQARFHRRQRRSIEAEVPLAAPTDDSQVSDIPVGDPGPDPAEAVAIADEMQQLLAALDDQDRQVVQLKLQDMTNDEVARQLNLSERTVRRTLKRLEGRLRSTAQGEV